MLSLKTVLKKMGNSLKKLFKAIFSKEFIFGLLLFVFFLSIGEAFLFFHNPLGFLVIAIGFLLFVASLGVVIE